MKLITTILLIISVTPSLLAQEYTETISEEIAFETNEPQNVFYLANINGHVKATAYDGNKILLKAVKAVRANNNKRLDEASSELSIGIIDRVDTILVYIKGPCGKFEQGDYKYSKSKSNWCYNWNECDYKYDFTFDFELQVPRNQRVYLSTVNKGDIVVENLDNVVNAHNVNGGITLNNIGSNATAHTINGDVKVSHSNIPKSGKSNFYTLNGDINAYYPKGLRADMSFKSYNGEFYTNINEIEYKPTVLQQSKSSAKKGVSFKVDSRSMISVRGGGPTLNFETFNGDVFVREQ